MSEAKFPRARDDGSVTVAARFTFDAPAAIGVARSVVSNWLLHREEEGVAVNEDLTDEPCVVLRDADTFDVVFEGRRESQWKDWMVALTQEMVSLVPNVKFKCFYDLVGDVAHPASRVSR